MWEVQKFKLGEHEASEWINKYIVIGKRVDCTGWGNLLRIICWSHCVADPSLTSTLPQIGFGSNKKTRHLMPSGHKAFLVHNTRDVDLLLMHNKTYAAEYVKPHTTLLLDMTPPWRMLTTS